MKLELKHLAPYLPYGLKAVMLDRKIDYVGKLVNNINGVYILANIWHCETSGGSRPSIDRIKPILRPLSDLTKEIEHNGERFIPIEELSRYSDGSNHELEWIEHLYDFDFKLHEVDFLQSPYRFMDKLFEWHFDVFGLIDAGLAVDINTIEI